MDTNEEREAGEEVPERPWPFPWKEPDCVPEHEYFVDSDGEKYGFNSDGTRDGLTRKEYREYCRQVNESDGYDVQITFPDVETYGLIGPDNVDDPLFERLACLAVCKYNTHQQETRLKFVKMTNACSQVIMEMTYYLTFTVMDGNSLKTLQARFQQIGFSDEYDIEEIRFKPAT